MKLEEMMLENGWRKRERLNCGKLYTEFYKNGFVVDEEDIWEDEDYPYGNEQVNKLGGQDGKSR